MTPATPVAACIDCFRALLLISETCFAFAGVSPPAAAASQEAVIGAGATGASSWSWSCEASCTGAAAALELVLELSCWSWSWSCSCTGLALCSQAWPLKPWLHWHRPSWQTPLLEQTASGRQARWATTAASSAKATTAASSQARPAQGSLQAQMPALQVPRPEQPKGQVLTSGCCFACCFEAFSASRPVLSSDANVEAAGALAAQFAPL
mmetsp:Transcript_10206/g.18614  ORF Transcript_10206/g.18614 Transcript_10206/m.18614 type:complete len:209 (+) Transcript_10206:166-792(+)